MMRDVFAAIKTGVMAQEASRGADEDDGGRHRGFIGIANTGTRSR